MYSEIESHESRYMSGRARRKGAKGPFVYYMSMYALPSPMQT